MGASFDRGNQSTDQMMLPNMGDPVHTADSVEYDRSAGVKRDATKSPGPPSEETVHQCKARHLLRVKANVGHADGGERGMTAADAAAEVEFIHAVQIGFQIP